MVVYRVPGTTASPLGSTAIWAPQCQHYGQEGSDPVESCQETRQGEFARSERAVPAKEFAAPLATAATAASAATLSTKQSAAHHYHRGHALTCRFSHHHLGFG